MDLFLRRARLQYEREFIPWISSAEPGRRAIINQFSFVYFSLCPEPAAFPLTFVEDKFKAALERASNDISLIDKVPPDQVAPLSESELEESRSQIWRLQTFFAKLDQPLEFFPRFPGCGIIDSSVGDLIVKDCLFEIKAGERGFLSVDIKQLITYAALNYASRSTARDITYFGLFNPRVGISYRVSVEELSKEVSGTSSSELLSEVVRIVSSGDISR